MSVNEEEARRYIKELFPRVSPKPDSLLGSSLKRRDNYDVTGTVSLFL